MPVDAPDEQFVMCEVRARVVEILGSRLEIILKTPKRESIHHSGKNVVVESMSRAFFRLKEPRGGRKRRSWHFDALDQDVKCFRDIEFIDLIHL
jgi:hypothetical protein